LCTVDKGIGSNFEFGFRQWRGTVHLACFLSKAPAEAFNTGIGFDVSQRQGLATNSVATFQGVGRNQNEAVHAGGSGGERSEFTTVREVLIASGKLRAR